jgi:hypothetical protein
MNKKLKTENEFKYNQLIPNYKMYATDDDSSPHKKPIIQKNTLLSNKLDEESLTYRTVTS